MVAIQRKEPKVSLLRAVLALIVVPPGYRLRLDPDLPVLCRPDGSEVAAFGAHGALAERMEAVAREDARPRGGWDRLGTGLLRSDPPPDDLFVPPLVRRLVEPKNLQVLRRGDPS